MFFFCLFVLFAFCFVFAFFFFFFFFFLLIIKFSPIKENTKFYYHIAKIFFEIFISKQKFQQITENNKFKKFVALAYLVFPFLYFDSQPPFQSYIPNSHHYYESFSHQS